ncbi:hypothetical protein A8F94_21810 [Bacillus sp. FJAT-27225]|uniref:hypothetical protein n=1 Tax=Bacillus sp. FJAT-27225 TaxID=1743144 RepID=UPI00080C28AE|nr:hypothetical protein [Bacillus sp. FJAT-27225]OCA81515.1 hypothetical protein A8F94_21810 [Bacillus sp. FJAT-27225]
MSKNWHVFCWILAGLLSLVSYGEAGNFGFPMATLVVHVADEIFLSFNPLGLFINYVFVYWTIRLIKKIKQWFLSTKAGYSILL